MTLENIENNIYDISKKFALRIIKLNKFLLGQNEFVMSKQVLRSGTSIGANVNEGKYAQSRPDFSNKMNIALKEAGETQYWLDLLHESHYIDDKEYDSISDDCSRILGVLIKIVKSTKTPHN